MKTSAVTINSRPEQRVQTRETEPLGEMLETHSRSGDAPQAEGLAVAQAKPESQQGPERGRRGHGRGSGSAHGAPAGHQQGDHNYKTRRVTLGSARSTGCGVGGWGCTASGKRGNVSRSRGGGDPPGRFRGSRSSPGREKPVQTWLVPLRVPQGLTQTSFENVQQFS